MKKFSSKVYILTFLLVLLATVSYSQWQIDLHVDPTDPYYLADDEVAIHCDVVSIKVILHSNKKFNQAGNPSLFTITYDDPVDGPQTETFTIVDLTGDNDYYFTITGNPGVYTLTRVQDGDGTDLLPLQDIFITNNIHPDPVVSFTNTDPAYVGVGSNLTLTANPAGYADYTWAGHASINGSTGLVNSTTFNSGSTGSFPVSVTVTDGNGCNATDNITVEVSNLSATAAATTATTICQGSTVTMDGQASGGSGNYSHSWSYTSAGTGTGSFNNNLSEDPVFTPNNVDTYTLTYTVTDNITSAVASDDIVVTVNAAPTIKTVNTADYCAGGLGGTLTVVSSDANVSYKLINNTTSTTVSTQVGVAGVDLTWNNLLAADYYIEATDQITLCTVDYPLETITENPLPAVAPTIDDNPVCEGTTTLLHANAPTAVMWSWDNAASIAGSNTIANPVASPSGFTNYTVTVTDANGCINSGSVSVNVTAAPTININDDQGNTFTICEGDNITLTGTSTKAIATWSWSNGDATASTTINPTTTTTYNLSVIDTDGCTNDKNQVVTVNDRPTANAGSDEVMCSGVGVTLTASATDGDGSYSYLWSGGATPAAQSNTVNPLNDATYTVTVTDGNGCWHTDDVFVDVVTNPTVSVGAAAGFSLAICDGESTDLEATPAGGTAPYNYNWPHSGASTSIVTVNPSNPVLDAGPVSTNYTVVVTDNNGCQATDNISVTTNSLSAITIANDGEAYCQDAGIVTLSASPAGGTWSDVSTPGFIIAPNTFDPAPPTTPTFYTVEYEYTNTNGCTNTSQATVEVLPYATPVISIDQPLNGDTYCNTGDPAVEILTTDNVGGQPNITREITGPVPGITDDGDGTGWFDPSDATGAGVGSHTITYTVTTPGCNNSTNITVDVGNPVNITALTDMCVGDGPQALNVDVGGGTWVITFDPDADPTPADAITTSYPEGDPLAVLNATEPGEYTVDYQLTVGTCSNTTTVTCRVNALPTPDFEIGSFNQADGGINFCSNIASVNLTPTPAGGSFSSTPAGNVNTSTFEPATVGAGNYTITYTYTDGNGCTDAVTSNNITVNTAPTVDITGLATDYCSDDAAFTITGDPTSGNAGSGSFTFPAAWGVSAAVEAIDNGNGTAEITPTNISTTGTFNITYSVDDLNGCTGTTTETFTLNALPSVDFNGLPVIVPPAVISQVCKNADPMTLTGSPTTADGSFTIIPGITDNGDGTATFDPSALTVGVHTITYTYTNPVTLCTNSISKDVEILSSPNQYTVTAPGGTDYCEGDAGVQLAVTNSQNGYTYNLIRNGSTVVATQVSGAAGAFTFGGTYTNGNYTVEAIDPVTSCTQSFSNTVTVNEIPAIDDAGAIAGNASICADGSTIYEYSVPAIANATDYVWNLPPDVSLVTDKGDTIEVRFDPAFVTGDIEVYGIDPGNIVCPDGLSSSKAVTASSIPVIVGGPSITGADVVCEGETGRTYSIAGAAFDFETSYEWQTTVGTITTDPTASSVTVDFPAGTVSGNIQVRGVNACGVSNWVTLSITVNPIPNVSINALGVGDVITCDPASRVTLNAATTEVGAITWLWTVSNGGVIDGATNAITADASHEGDFEVQIGVTTNALECYNTATITVGADKVAPTVTIDVPDELNCNNTTETLQANAVGVSYDWTFTPPANISIPAAPPYNTSNPTVDQPGTYTVTVTDLSNSCTASASTTVTKDVTLPDISVVSPSADILTCTNLTATLDGGSSTANKTFLWTGPDPTITNATLEDAIVDVPGVYTLEVTNTDNGCSDTRTVTVLQDINAPAVVINNVDAEYNDLTCSNTEVDLEASVAAVPNATFVWSDGGGNIVSQSGAPYNEAITVDAPATYSVTATDPGNGCTTVVTETVAEDLTTATTTNINAASTVLTCTNSSTINLAANITGDGGGIYTWSGTGTLVPPLDANNVDVTSAGTYTLTYAHSVTGCETTANIVITDETAAPTVNIDAGPYEITCINLSAKRAITPTLTATGDPDPLTTYAWTGPAGATYSNQTGLSTTVDKAGTYTITAENQYGCTVSDNVTVTLNTSLPDITVTDPEPELITCASSTVALEGSSTTALTDLLWTGPGTATITGATTQTPTVNEAGVYTLTVTNTNNGCESSATVTVGEDTAIPIITSLVNNDVPANLSCDNLTAQLEVQSNVPAANFTWNSNPGVIDATSGSYNQFVEVSAAGDYDVYAVNPNNGCQSLTSTITVTEDLTAPNISITSAQTELTCNVTSITIDGSATTDADTWTWTYTAGGNITSGQGTNTIVVDAPATYTLTAENSLTGCTSTSDYIITQDISNPTVSINAAAYEITCDNVTETINATGDADPLTLYSWSGPSIIGPTNGLNITVDQPGTYSIVATATNGCTTTDNVTVTDNTATPDITLASPLDLTCSRSTVQISGSSTTADTYLWNLQSGSGSIDNPNVATTSVDGPGTFRLTVTNSANGCSNFGDVVVVEDLTTPGLSVTSPATDILTCDINSVQLEAATTVSGSNFSWSTGTGGGISDINVANPFVDTPGDYTVIAEHPVTGCTQAATVTVNSNYTAPTVNIVPEATVITCTQSTIELDASASTNATGFSWSTSDGNIVSGGTTNTAIISEAGTYNLTVTNGATGCTASGQVVITDNLATPNVNIIGGPYTITCTDPDPELAATVDVGSSVVWSGPGSITNGTTLNPTIDTEGTFTITATAANGCTATDNVLVTLDNSVPDISVDINPDDITCSNTLVTVSGSSVTAGATYLWSVLSGGGNITNNTNATTTVDADGDYQLTVTAPNGCTNTDVVTVVENNTAPNISLPGTDDDEITCSQTSVTLNGSSTTPGALFSWSTAVAGATITNDNSPTPTVDKTGDYTMLVTDPVNGCTSTATTTVNGTFTQPVISIAAPGSQITCSNPTLVLDASGSTNATNYSWSASLGGHILSDGNTAQPTVDAAGRYTVTAEHTSTGCTASSFVDVTEDNSVPTIDVFKRTTGTITCNDLTVDLTADATGLLPANKTILWETSDGNITTAAGLSTITIDQAGTYKVTITNTTTGCSTIRSTTITENKTSPTITIDAPLDLTCSRNQVNLNATGTSVDGSALTYAWAAGAGGNIVSGNTTATAVVNAVADYTVTVTDLGNGCVNTSTVTVSEDVTPPDVSVDVNPDPITCNNSTVILNGSSTYPNVSYQWTTTGTGTILNNTTTTPIVNAAGTYNLTVTNTDNNCSATSVNVNVTEDKVAPAVAVNAPSGDITCSVNEVTISVEQNADYNYSWSGVGNITTPNSYSTNVDAAGTYTCIVEDIDNGCQSTYTVDVSEDKTAIGSPVINNIETCFGSTNPSFTVLSGTNVKWYDDVAKTVFLGTGNTYTPTATAAGTHTYYATSTGANGCESVTTEVILTIYSLPAAPVTVDNAICEGSAGSQLSAIGSNIKWYDNTSTFIQASATYTPADVAVGTYNYYATQTDANGCESAQAEATYNINSVPLAPSFVDATIETCETETNPSFTVAGNNIKWYKTIGGAVVSTGNTHQPNEIVPGVYNYYATQTENGCESNTESGTFTINEMPTIYNVEDGGSYCEGSGGTDITLSNSEVGINYELWLDETTMITDIAGDGNQITFANQTVEGNYTVYAYNATSLCRIKMNGSVDISINPLPGAAPTITGSAEVCQNETGVSYSVPAIANATNYEWTVPAGFNIVSGSNSNSITVNVDNTASSGNITVYAENACGVGATSPVFHVTVNPIPGPALNLTGPGVICKDEDGVTFTVDADPNAIYYNWTLPQGATISAGENSRQITLDFDQTAVNDVIIVSAANACGEGAPASQAIIVNDLPYVSAGEQQDLCVDNTILEANTPASGTGTWSVFSGAVTLSGVNDPAATATNIGEGNNRLVWTVVDANGCSLSDTVLITNNTVIVEAGNNQVVCEESITLDASTVPDGAVGSWSATTGSANFSDGNSPTAVASGFTSGVNVLKWTVTKGGCTSYDTLVVDNQRPTQAYAGIDLSICGDTTYLDANDPAIGTGLWTVVIGAATFEDPTQYNTRVSGLSLGENVLRWTISNGICSTSDELTVINNKIVVDAGVDQIICKNTTTLDAIELTTGTGYWSIESGSASFVDVEDPSTIVTGLSQGDNVLTWNVNNNSCISSDSVTITNDSPTPAYAGKDTTITTDLTTLQGNIPIIGTGGWSLISGSGTIDDPLLHNTTVSSLGIGENTFRWTVTHNSCISTDDVIITNANASPPNAGSDQTLCSDETILEGNEPVFGYGEWSVISGSATFKDVNNPTTEVTGLAKGDNVLRWSIWENGWTSDSVIITNDSPSDANAGLDQILCSDSTFLAGNNPIVGKGKWTVISGAGTFANDSLYNTKVTNLAKGENVFKWTITNRACSDEDIVIVRNDLPTIAEAGADATICESTITLSPNTPSVGTGYWSVAQGSAYFEGNTAKNIARGDNIFVWTIENNACSYSDSIQITNYEPSDANAGADKVICVDTITLKANTAVYGTGIWTQESGSSTFNPNIATTKVTDLNQGLNVFKWTITYNGCIKNDRVTINNASVNADAGLDQEICDESTYLEANNPPAGEGMWSVLGGSGSATFTNMNDPDTWVTDLDKGDNILRWTLTNEICSDYDDVIITNNLPTEAFAGPDQELCDDNSILQGNTPMHGTGEWSILSGSADISAIDDPSSTVTNLDYGVNTLRWTITNGSCVSTDEVTIANNSTITSNAGLDQILCVDSTIVYANVPTYGVGTWSVVTGSATFADNNDYNTKVTNIGKGSNELRWVIANGDCSSSSEITITNNAPSKAIAGGDQTICGDSTILQANNPTYGTGSWSLVSGAAKFNDPAKNNTDVTGLNPGLNTLRWTVENNGCTSSDDVIIYNDLPYEADAGEDFSVCGASSSLYANDPVLGAGEWTVVSGAATFGDSSRFDASVADLAFGANTLRWTITYDNCTTYDEVVVTNNKIKVYAGVDQTVTESTTLLAANNPSTGTGSWSLIGGSGSFEDPTNSITEVYGLGAGLNTFRWSVDVNGCISFDDVEVTYNMPPVASFVVTKSAGCPPLDVYFVNNSLDDLPFTWDFDDGSASGEITVKHTYTEPGIYKPSLTVINNEGVAITKDTTITVYDQPEASFLIVNRQVYIPEEEAIFVNTSTDADTYQWDFGDGSTSTESDPKYTYTEEGIYDILLEVWSVNNCYDSTVVTAGVVVEQSGTIVFPNAFTPNLDGPSGGYYNPNDFTNDVFFPIGSEGIEEYHLEIFNKWGILVFESKDVNIGWDGYYNGTLLNEGVYVWKVTGTLNNEKPFKEVGTVLLIR